MLAVSSPLCHKIIIFYLTDIYAQQRTRFCSYLHVVGFIHALRYISNIFNFSSLLPLSLPILPRSSLSSISSPYLLPLPIADLSSSCFQVTPRKRLNSRSSSPSSARTRNTRILSCAPWRARTHEVPWSSFLIWSHFHARC